MVARDFALIPPIERLIQSLYSANLPSLFAMFDINPIAAMPSLHTAMPALCALMALRYLGLRGLIVVAYAVAAGTGVIYLGEHYAVDVVAGVLLAATVFAGVRRWGAPATSLKDSENAATGEHLAPRPIIVGIGLVVLAFAFGPLSMSMFRPLPITIAFVERELVGRSPAANYLLGRIAFEGGDYAAAYVRFKHALDELRRPDERGVILDFLRQSEERAGQLAIPGHAVRR